MKMRCTHVTVMFMQKNYAEESAVDVHKLFKIIFCVEMLQHQHHIKSHPTIAINFHHCENIYAVFSESEFINPHFTH